LDNTHASQGVHMLLRRPHRLSRKTSNQLVAVGTWLVAIRRPFWLLMAGCFDC
jgi:hypothetical protein